jgi:hypothetical protein
MPRQFQEKLYKIIKTFAIQVSTVTSAVIYRGTILEVSAKVLPKLKIAHVIGKALWDQGGDIRNVISIGKLVRKNDGPEEVEQILSTMTKYGEMEK